MTTNSQKEAQHNEVLYEGGVGMLGEIGGLSVEQDDRYPIFLRHEILHTTGDATHAT